MTDGIERGRRLYREELIRMSGSATAVLARFQAMREYRDSRPAAAARALRLLGWAIGGVVLSMILIAIVRPVGTVLLPIALGTAAVAIFQRIRALAPLDSRAETLLEPFLRRLTDDLGRQQLRLVASVAPLRSRQFLQQTEKAPGGGKWRRTDRTYGRELLCCSCRLRDGSRIWLAAKEKLVESTRRRWGGSRKNKLKTRVKYRNVTAIILRVAPPPGWSGSGARITFPADCRIRWVERKGVRAVEIRFREKKLKGQDGVSPDRTLRLLQLVYQGFSADSGAVRGGLK